MGPVARLLPPAGHPGPGTDLGGVWPRKWTELDRTGLAGGEGRPRETLRVRRMGVSLCDESSAWSHLCLVLTPGRQSPRTRDMPKVPSGMRGWARRRANVRNFPRHPQFTEHRGSQILGTPGEQG